MFFRQVTLADFPIIALPALPRLSAPLDANFRFFCALFPLRLLY